MKNRIVPLTDLAIQSGLFIWALYILSRFLLTDSDPFAILIVQFFLGCWQMFSAFISILTRRPLMKLRIIHFCSALVYLTLLFLIVKENTSYYALFLFGPSWSLATLYLYISAGSVFKTRTKQSAFLPHSSF
jgi:hypothetical protein